MSSQRSAARPVSLKVRNIGGIDDTEVAFEPGITVLEGRNATNRTSLLQAIMAACGSDSVSVKGDAKQAEVELTTDGTSYKRTLRRENGTVVSDGESYLEDPELAELFAFLLESNEARQAVARGDDLREIIMRPVDTAAIKAEIKQYEARKDQIDDQLAQLDDLQAKLPNLEEKRTGLKADIEDTETELESVQSAIDDEERDLETEREEQAAVEEKLAELRDLRSEIDDVRYDQDTERESIEALQEELASVEADLEDLSDPPEGDVDEMAQEIGGLRDQRQRLERKVKELNTVIQFNEEMLEESKPHVQGALDSDAGSQRDGSVTDRLLEDDDSVTCWTCGSVVDAGKIEDTVAMLRDVRSDTATEMDEVADAIEDLESKRRRLESQRRRRQELEDRITRIESEIAERESTVESLGERREELEAEITAVENEVEELRTESESELLDLHEQANELEFELGRLQNQLDSVESEIEEIESRLGDRESLEAERSEVQSELEELRTRIERIQQEAVEAFNDHMDTVLELLEYDNIDRVWIERTQTEVREGRSKTTKPVFDLHVIRNPEDGGAYEDTVDHLSESEREVIGLVFALAGYLVHDVDEVCPFILLDSLEAFDAERIASLVSYLEDHSEFLVVALLPEDASAIESSHQRIREI